MINARIFFIIPHYVNNSNGYIECDIKDHLLESAANAGATTALFWEDDIAYPGLRPTPVELAHQRLAECQQAIHAFKPDFIVYDACFKGNELTINRNYLATIRAECNAKLIGFMGDAWSPNWVGEYAYWRDVSNRLIYVMPSHYQQIQLPKLLNTPYPVNEKNFYPDTKDIDVSFLGTNYNWRTPFLMAAVEACQHLKLNFYIRGHDRRNDCPTMDEYASITRRSKIVLNLALRSNGVGIITGRVWQALHSNCLLLEEDNIETSCFFTPWEHYVPFQTPTGLYNAISQGIKNWHNNPMPKRAYDYCREHYSAEKIWHGILDGLL